ncbi:hypothetical protein FTUN_3783 [Frigoriglobus tundricola]|uniref:Uncharacterized protein n=1 Tax=Frigoriglobus tundricola TaxID=2774151 RepID=A0A6M5YS59_9BACT|nr:hypothetical protein FTUN_3783 [Frigoriglobus tundricola]
MLTVTAPRHAGALLPSQVARSQVIKPKTGAGLGLRLYDL